VDGGHRGAIPHLQLGRLALTAGTPCAGLRGGPRVTPASSFVVRVAAEPELHVIVETKGFDPLAEVNV
jgi:hypothetical protein